MKACVTVVMLMHDSVSIADEGQSLLYWEVGLHTHTAHTAHSATCEVILFRAPNPTLCCHDAPCVMVASSNKSFCLRSHKVCFSASHSASCAQTTAHCLGLL